jgi:hypothetical protein
LRFSDKHLFRCASGIRNYDKEKGPLGVGIINGDRNS